MRNVVILGSGRSGTSMLAGCFAAAGFHLGGPVLDATPSNPKGLFEVRAVNDANEDLMRAARPLAWRPGGLGRYLRWLPRQGQGWLVPLPTRVHVVPTSGFAERAQTIVAQTPYCLKDPRFSYTLHCWRPYLEDVVFVCMFRHPGITIASMLREAAEAPYLSDFWITRRRVIQTWLWTYRWILDIQCRDGDWIFCHYDQIIGGQKLQEIETSVGVSLDRHFPDQRISRTRDAASVPEALLTTYEELCARARYREAVQPNS